jgi:hypothetical protein
MKGQEEMTSTIDHKGTTVASPATLARHVTGG